MKKATPEDLKKLSAIMAKDNPAAYAQGYRDAEQVAVSEVNKLCARIEHLEYQNKHLINYLHGSNAADQ